MVNFYKFIKQLSLISTEIITQYFTTDLTIEYKHDQSPVTIADKIAEEKMRNLIMKNYPEHGIIGEEFGLHQQGAEYQWVLDPIDGTKSFIHGVPTFGTLIALLHNGQPILGAIKLPIQNDFLFGDGHITKLNGKPVRVRACSDISKATLLTTDHLKISKYKDIKKFDRLIRMVKMYRTWGDCFGYFLLATGRADIMIDPIMSPWDSLALIPIIKGAGGIITDYEGNEPVEGSSTIAANPDLHPQVIKILQSER